MWLCVCRGMGGLREGIDREGKEIRTMTESGRNRILGNIVE